MDRPAPAPGVSRVMLSAIPLSGWTFGAWCSPEFWSASSHLFAWKETQSFHSGSHHHWMASTQILPPGQMSLLSSTEPTASWTSPHQICFQSWILTLSPNFLICFQFSHSWVMAPLFTRVYRPKEIKNLWSFIFVCILSSQTKYPPVTPKLSVSPSSHSCPQASVLSCLGLCNSLIVHVFTSSLAPSSTLPLELPFPYHTLQTFSVSPFL